MVGRVSLLLNNKQENPLHDYPLLCVPDVNGKMSQGKTYKFSTNKIELNTKVDSGYVLSIVFKASEYMNSFIQSDPATYSSYNPKLIVAVVYDDEKGDEYNDEYKTIRLIKSTDG